ncbi:MAG: hypothetical protein LBI82_08925 [Dysgonamonadaceae bacterium]|jgi:hypothetical protein|nr:hypothetical protein [Dysgonamonadaceae bacterium]
METQPKNYIYSVFFLVVLVVIILIGLKIADEGIEGELFSYAKKVFSQEQEQEQYFPVVEDQPFPPPGSAGGGNTDTFSNDDNLLGIVRFTDYSPNANGLHSFLGKLCNIETLNRPIRIAFFGDSFIEGDILSGDLRRLFQENMGGKGVGMMPITSQVNGFRKTVVHQFSAWDTHSFNNCSDKSKLGIAGYEYTPNRNAWVYYQGVNKDHLDSCNRVSVFYTLEDNDTRIFYKKNKGTSVYAQLPKADKVSRVNIDGSCGNIQISFPQLNGLHVYGVSLEDTAGVILDNYSIRSFSGAGLKNLSKLSQFNDLLQYDLIILGYGLNVMEPKRTEYESYKAEMIQMINHLKSSFPSANFLLISVPDRSYKENGNYETMPGVSAMIKSQEDICEKTGIVFWNLFEAMGGRNSMPLFVDSTPPKANKDYTHLTFAGGEYLGNLLYETFIHEKDVYKKRHLQTVVK